MADSQAAFSWMVRGLSGAVNLIEREQAEGTPISEHWLGEMRRQAARLTAIADKLEGVDNHGEGEST